jgi:hypothetical protein
MYILLKNMLDSILYICFHSNGEPFISKYNVRGCRCITTNLSNYKNVYLNFRQQYLYKQIQINTMIKINTYNSYHNIASQGSTYMSKSVLGRIASEIYVFRKSI